MITSLREFERDLEGVVGSQTRLRPFICEGSPIGCQVFIVGFNPATTMDATFWDFWRPGEGFDKSAWFEAYKNERASRPLRPGKTRRNPVSNTRRVIGWITSAAAPLRILETNIHSLPSDDKAGLAVADRQTEVVAFLLRSLGPRVIVTHGDDAGRVVRRLAVDAEMIETKHFSRGWSREAAERLGADLKQIAGS